MYHVIKNCPISYILEWICEIGSEDDMIERYQHDFVHMAYAPQSEDPEAEIEVTN